MKSKKPRKGLSPMLLLSRVAFVFYVPLMLSLVDPG
jgi:hypothetical protein